MHHHPGSPDIDYCDFCGDPARSVSLEVKFSVNRKNIWRFCCTILERIETLTSVEIVYLKAFPHESLVHRF